MLYDNFPLFTERWEPFLVAPPLVVVVIVVTVHVLPLPPRVLLVTDSHANSHSCGVGLTGLEISKITLAIIRVNLVTSSLSMVSYVL
jgi:hypothetical protein